MKRSILINKVLTYMMVLSILLSGFITKTPSAKAESLNKPATYAKLNTDLDIGWSFQNGVPPSKGESGSIWKYVYDDTSFDYAKKAITYTPSASSPSPYIHIYFDKEFKTTGKDYWICVLYQQGNDINFSSSQLFQSSDYIATLYNSSASRASWSYSTVTNNGVEYKLATAKISGFGSNQTVTGVRVYAEQAPYTVYSSAIYLNEQDALSYAGMFPTYEVNDYLTYGLYNMESDFKGIRPSDSVPPVDAGTAWGSSDCEAAYFNADLKGASFTSNPSARSWTTLHFNKEYMTTGDDYVIAVLYSSFQDIGSSFNTLKDYQFSINTDAGTTVPFTHTFTVANDRGYDLAYAKIINMKEGEKITGVQVSLAAGQSYAFIASAVLKNDTDMGEVFNSILRDTMPLEEETGKYEGSQIRTTLVPYKNDYGQLNLSDMRQGLRFCFTLPEIGETIVYQGKQYSVQEQKAMIILKEQLADKGDLTLHNQEIADKLKIQSNLIEWSNDIQTYKTVYVYNIPKGYKDTVIVVRAYLVCKDDMGETVCFYSNVQEKSITDVYNSIVSSGDEHLLDQAVKDWWSL